MTIYLSNREVRPTGYEAGEFLESPTIAPAVEPNPGTREVDDDDETIQGVVDVVDARLLREPCDGHRDQRGEDDDGDAAASFRRDHENGRPRQARGQSR